MEAGVRPTDEAIGDRGGDAGVEHGLGVGRLADAQADAQTGVGVDLRRQGALEVLRDEQQVESEGAADAGDRLELPQLLAPALTGQQLAELVDDDDQAGECRQLRAPPAGDPVRVEVARPRRRQQVLAPARLRLQHHDRAPELLDVEVRRHVDDVGKRPHGIVVDAALEVDDDDRQIVGVVVQAQRHEQRLQELGLAGARRPADEAVRPVAHEVDDHRHVRRRADHD